MLMIIIIVYQSGVFYHGDWCGGMVFSVLSAGGFFLVSFVG